MPRPTVPNPPAFPQPSCPDCGVVHAPEHVPGMTLRDYFAAHTLAAFADQAVSLSTKRELMLAAEAAYNLADALLEVRNR